MEGKWRRVSQPGCRGLLFVDKQGSGSDADLPIENRTRKKGAEENY